MLHEIARATLSMLKMMLARAHQGQKRVLTCREYSPDDSWYRRRELR